jgi:dolichol-phosphate mannosyltransferase
MRALVVLPTYNEAANIAVVLRRIRAAVPAADVLVVDDNSPDGTADLAEGVGGDLGQIHLLRRPGKSGLGPAYRSGFAWGLERGYDAFVEMDADLSHDPDALPALLGGLERANLVIGSRYIPGGSIPNWARHRRWLSEWGNRYAALMLGMTVKDLTAGFRAYDAATLRAIELDRVRADGYGFQIEMAFRTRLAGGTVAETPICFVDRVLGDSKMSLRTVVEALALVSLWGLRRLTGGYRGAIRPLAGSHSGAQLVLGEGSDGPAQAAPSVG